VPGPLPNAYTFRPNHRDNSENKWSRLNKLHIRMFFLYFLFSEPVDKRIGIEERRAYMPPNDVVEKIKAAAESIYGPSENWQDVELTSRIKKFDVS